jgi:hypothetical protein
MIRFSEAAAAEEEEQRNRRRKFSYDGQRSIDIPKIQINSKDDQDIVGLERKASRRRSSGSVVQQQLLWAQRRFSQKGSSDLGEIVENSKRQKSPKPALEEPPKKEMVRQRSESEEREEAEFERVRAKMALQGQSSLEKRSIDVVDEDKWMEEYEESLSESETESSEDERDFVEKSPPRVYSDEEEDTYHPGVMTTMKKPSDEPFEILTKRNRLPDPNFVPKPILKKTEDKVESPKEVPLEVPRDITPTKTRSHSPRPQFRQPQEIVARERSQSLIQTTIGAPPNSKLFQRSMSLKEEAKDPEMNLLQSPKAAPGQNISAVATLCGFTAASIVIPEQLLKKKKDEEESKVVVDHYMDIVRSYGQKKKGVGPSWRTVEEEKKVWNAVEEEEEVPKTIQKEEKVVKQEEKLPQVIKAEEKIPKVIQQPWKSAVEKPQPPKLIQHLWKTVEESEPPQTHWKEEEEPVKATEVAKPVQTLRQEVSRRDRSPSPSPSPHRTSPVQHRGRSINHGPRKAARSKTPSKSPSRLENWSGRSQRKSSPSPMKVAKSTVRRSPSPSPIPLAKPRPKLKEIMTQTSIGLELNYSSDSRTSTPHDRRHEELVAKAEGKVRGFVEYATDLAMFAVACWLYLFSNELFAIPVLLVMVYRQLKSEVRKRIPGWIARRFNKTKTKKP